MPIKPKHFWCMHCLRTSMKNFDPPADAPLEINCILDANASVACQQCSSRNSACIPAATAMPGDAHDLAAVLSWAKKHFWAEN